MDLFFVSFMQQKQQKLMQNSSLETERPTMVNFEWLQVAFVSRW